MNRLTPLVLGLALLSLQAQADHRKHHYNSDYDFAKVVHVEPLSRTVQQRIPREQCYVEQVAVEEPGYRQGGSYTNELVGGVIGGAIGNALGSNKSNKKVQAVIGAALGASIANDMERRNGRNHYQPGYVRYEDVERCTVRHDVEYHEEITGYRVTYKYHGRTYQTRMNHHPGKRIKVRVDVRPM